MKKKTETSNAAIIMEEDDQLTLLPADPDICSTLMSRYSKSTAPQHHHLCASAAAMKTILQQENLPLTPLSYFFATIDSLSNPSLDSTSIAPLSSLLTILLPLVPENSITPNKAGDAVFVLVQLVQNSEAGLSTATMRCVVQCLGSLMLLCDFEDWGMLKVAFQMILRFSIDKRPKVRRCAQMCVEKVFKLFPGSVIKEASKVVLSLFKSYMPHAIELNDSRLVDGSKREMLSKPDHMEVVHMLNAVKFVVPYLSKKVSQKILFGLYKLLTCRFSPLTRHLFDVLEVVLVSSGADVIVPEAENIIVSLTAYVSYGDKNPMDTVMSASGLLRSIMDKLHSGEPSICTRKLPLVFGSIAGLLVFDTYGSQASGILKEMINKHIDGSTFLGEYPVSNDKLMAREESRVMKSTCAVFEDILCTSDGVPNEHILAVISNLFIKLGDISYIFMKGSILKLAGIMHEERDVKETKHIQECIGSALMAIGPEKMLALIPVTLDPEKHICSNIWLVPILKEYLTGASLEYFLGHILPLLESLKQAHQKAKKSSRRQDLQACIHCFWDLLPAFCRYPTDTHKCFGPLAKVLVDSLKEDCFMHQNISLSLQELVNQNTSILVFEESVSGSAEISGTYSAENSCGESKSVPLHYSKEVATRNIQAIKSCSMDLLQALTDVFFNSPQENRKYLKEAIGCLASITESSKVKKLFISSFKKFKAVDVEGELNEMEGDMCTSLDKDLDDNVNKEEQEEAERMRCMIMEFAHSLIMGAKEDLLDTILNLIKPILQATNGIGQSEAYSILSRIFEEHGWFCSTRFEEMVDLLLGVKSSLDIMTLRSRFSCYQNSLIYILKSDLEDRNAKAFLILNEIILALKDSNEEPRKAAYDLLLKISDSLNDASSADSDSPLQQLFNMIIGYLSGAPPPIMSAAVAALSLLMYKNSGICLSIPELVPSVLILLKSKAKEVIKAVLGFVKVLVSCIQTSDLQKLLPDIVNEILPWSSVSKNHFRSKVTTIFEIIIRKCGYVAVESLVPDKYKRFIKTVKEQRQGKTITKEAETSDNVSKLAVSSPSRENKRRHHVTTQGTNQMERINKKGKFMPSKSEPYKSTDIGRGGQWVHKSKSSPSDKSERWSGRSRKPTRSAGSNKRPSTGGKDSMRQRKEFKTRKPSFHKASPNSKFHKRRKAE